jgi:RNA polymerase sigma-70 factor (ECF subfamily)
VTKRLFLPALAARAQLGDRVALENLLRAIEQPLLHHVRAIVGDEDAAADVLQDSLVLICRRLTTLREPAWFTAWAYRIASRAAFRAARATRAQRHEPLDAWADPPAHDGELPTAEPGLLAELGERIAALPPHSQIAIRMFYLQELSQQEIAEALDIPLGTVKSRIAYGLSVLRRANWTSNAGAARRD